SRENCARTPAPAWSSCRLLEAAPHGLAATRLVEGGEALLVRGELLAGRPQHHQFTSRPPGPLRRLARGRDLTGLVERERALPTRHREVDVEQQLGVEQRAVQVAMRVVHRVALAERVEPVALP